MGGQHISVTSLQTLNQTEQTLNQTEQTQSQSEQGLRDLKGFARNVPIVVQGSLLKTDLSSIHIVVLKGFASFNMAEG